MNKTDNVQKKKKEDKKRTRLKRIMSKIKLQIMTQQNRN